MGGWEVPKVPKVTKVPRVLGVPDEGGIIEN